MTRIPWRARLAPLGDAVRFAPPASDSALSGLEAALGLALPAELRSLLAESNGLADRYGASVVWPAAEIARQNGVFRNSLDFRTLYMSFDSLLFFGEAGQRRPVLFPHPRRPGPRRGHLPVGSRERQPDVAGGQPRGVPAVDPAGGDGGMKPVFASTGVIVSAAASR